ncbi:MAG: hypothetical protein HQL94_05340 [Magnetococcales bacterium]|nr:hypothetical protein [Magnetococcales bacterium]
MMFFHLTPVFAAETSASQPVRELLSQYVNIDRADFKAKGKITLHRLQPLAGQLVLSQAQGDPEWIFKTIAPWNPALSKILRDMHIKELNLAEADLLLDGSRIQLDLQKATIPEGWVENVRFQQNEGGEWRVETAKLRLESMPYRFNSVALPLIGAMGFDQMQASGNREKGQALASKVFGQGWRGNRLEGSGEVLARDGKGSPILTHVAWNATGVHAPGLQHAAARVPALGDLLRFAGKDPKKQEPLDFERVLMQVEADNGGTVRIKSVRVEAPWVTISGDGSWTTKGKDGERAKLNLLAKTPDGKEKRFKATFPLSSLVEP